MKKKTKKQRRAKVVKRILKSLVAHGMPGPEAGRLAKKIKSFPEHWQHTPYLMVTK